MKITLEKYDRNNKENVEKSFKFICESFRRNLHGSLQKQLRVGFLVSNQ